MLSRCRLLLGKPLCRFASTACLTSESHPIKSQRLTFLGPPGSGKGTYSSSLKRKYGFDILSSGDLVRKIIHGQVPQEHDSKAVHILKECISHGELVPDKLMAEILEQFFFKKLKPGQGFILDGYPRSLAQAQLLQDGPHPIDMAFHFIVPDNIIVRKLSARRVCKGCGHNYNLCDINEDGVIMPPILPKTDGVCDYCGGVLIQRADDRKEVVEKRLQHYHRTGDQIVDFYKHRGRCIEMDARGSLEDRLAHIERLLHSITPA